MIAVIERMRRNLPAAASISAPPVADHPLLREVVRARFRSPGFGFRQSQWRRRRAADRNSSIGSIADRRSCIACTAASVCAARDILDW